MMPEGDRRIHRLRCRELGSIGQTLALTLHLAVQNALNARDESEVKLLDRQPDQVVGRSLAGGVLRHTVPRPLQPIALTSAATVASSSVWRPDTHQLDRTTFHRQPEKASHRTRTALAREQFTVAFRQFVICHRGADPATKRASRSIQRIAGSAMSGRSCATAIPGCLRFPPR